MTIRGGIIGRNFVVDWMLAAMEQVPELRPAAIYSRTEETGREFAEKYHLDAVFTDLEAFAASDAFDAAYIAGASRVVSIVNDAGMFGYHGIARLMRSLREEAAHPQDLKKLSDDYGMVI